MTKDEALRLALKALENSWTEPNNEQYVIEKEAITALRLAIDVENMASKSTYKEQLAPQRTWVGLTELDCVGWFGYDTGLRLWFETNKGDDGAIPLYKDQPQRTWVGLTDEEIQECLQGLPTQTIDVYARRIETKIKDKNT